MTDREEYGESSDALEREVLDRLRAVDPAAEVEPSAGFVASVLARRVEATAEEATPDVEPLTGAAAASVAHTPDGARIDGTVDDDGASPTPIDLAAARTARQENEKAPRRRWRPWLAGAAAAAVVGAAGFGAGSLAATGAFATGSGSDSGGAADAAAPESAPQYGEESGLGPGVTSGLDAATEDSRFAGPVTLDATGAGAAPSDGFFGRGGAEMTTMGGADIAGPWFYGHREFIAAGSFATEPGTATLYGLDPHRATEATVLQLADHFGVEGTSRLEWGMWNMGPEDGNGPTVSLSLDGAATISYFNWAIEPLQRCWEDPPTSEYDQSAPEWQEFEQRQKTCSEEVAASAPPAEDARRELVELLTDLGIDAADYELADLDSAGSGIAYVRASRIVDEQRTNVTFDLGLAPEGVASVWGSLADVTVLRDVAVVSETEAFERLSDPRYGAKQSGGFYPYAGMGDDSYEPPTQAPPAPAGSAQIEWSVTPIELTSVRLGLAQHYQSDGSVLLVPAYEFTDADGGTWSVVAVADEDLTVIQP